MKLFRLIAPIAAALIASRAAAQVPEFNAECDGAPTLGTMIPGNHLYLRVSLPKMTWCFEPCESKPISEVKPDEIVLKNTYERRDELGWEVWTLRRQSGELRVTFFPAKTGFFSLIPAYGWSGICSPTPFTGFGNKF